MRPSPVDRLVRAARTAVAIVGVAGVLMLAACSSPDNGAESGDTAETTTTTSASPTDALRLEEGQVQVGDLTFDVRTQGPEGGEAVILLHGFPETSYEWRAQQQALADAGYRTIAPDQRGYSAGARPTEVEDYAIDLLAQDVVDLADALDVEQFHLVGHDWGASVAWVVAATAPDRLLSLNAVSVPHPAAYSAALADPTGEQSQKSDYIDNFKAPGAAEQLGGPDSFFFEVAFGDSVDPEAAAEYRSVLGTPEAMQAALNWYVANDPTNRTGSALGAVTVPTMFVFSTEDCCLGRDAADATEDHVDAPYRYEVLEGVSHWVPEEAADELNALLLSHLEETG